MKEYDCKYGGIHRILADVGAFFHSGEVLFNSQIILHYCWLQQPADIAWLK